MQKRKCFITVQHTRSFLQNKFVQRDTVKVTMSKVSHKEFYDKVRHLQLLLLLKQM